MTLDKPSCITFKKLIQTLTKSMNLYIFKTSLEGLISCTYGCSFYPSWLSYNHFHNTWHKREIPQEISQPQTICKCSKLGWKGRVLTLSFNARLKTYDLRIWGYKRPKWSNKAQNIAWKSANLSQIEIFD